MPREVLNEKTTTEQCREYEQILRNYNVLILPEPIPVPAEYLVIFRWSLHRVEEELESLNDSVCLSV